MYLNNNWVKNPAVTDSINMFTSGVRAVDKGDCCLETALAVAAHHYLLQQSFGYKRRAPGAKRCRICDSGKSFLNTTQLRRDFYSVNDILKPSPLVSNRSC